MDKKIINNAKKAQLEGLRKAELSLISTKKNTLMSSVILQQVIALDALQTFCYATGGDSHILELIELQTEAIVVFNELSEIVLKDVIKLQENISNSLAGIIINHDSEPHRIVAAHEQKKIAIMLMNLPQFLVEEIEGVTERFEQLKTDIQL